MSPEDFAQKPAANQELLNNIPLWSTLAYAGRVFGGSMGCIGLLKKKAWSMMALLISLICCNGSNGLLVVLHHCCGSFMAPQAMACL